MSQSIDVGTVLGGRYKVTSSIVTSQEGDLVLDGVDQVLNRPVSILVSGPTNADQLAQSAREVATGERHGSVQVLDLGISHGSTYLITNHTAAADLLDLIVPQETPYVEPFFTDTLGSEIFGESRSREPETYDGTFDPGRPDQYIRYDDSGHPVGGGAAGAAGAAAAAAARQGRQPGSYPPGGHPAQPGTAGAPGTAGQAGSIPPRPPAPPRNAPGADQGSPAQWPPAQPSPQRPPGAGDASTQAFGAPGSAAGAAAAGAGAAAQKVTPWPPAQGDASARGGAPTAATPQQRPGSSRPHYPPNRPAAVLPAAARSSSDDDDFEDDEATRPRSMPWVVGGVLAVVLIAALIFAFTTLGGLFQPQSTGTATGSPQASQPAPSSSGAAQPSTSGSNPPAPTGPPVIDSVTRMNPGELEFANAYDSKLSLTFDGNTATYWSDMEFAREDWGGYAKSVTLAVKLKDPAQVKQITLLQSGGSGGNVSIYTNSQPSLTGAALAGTTSFTGPQLSVPVTGSPTAQYVLVQINTLPRLSAPKTQYPYGLRLAEIKVE